MLENFSKSPYPTINLPHKQLEKNIKSILAKHHLKRRVTCAVSFREHGSHSHEKAMEMDPAGTCLEENPLTSHAEPSIVHQQERGKEKDPRSPGEEL